MSFNLDSLKVGFLDFLKKQGKTIPPEDLQGNISIFKYAKDFKDYLEQENGIDNSLMSKSLSEIIEMEINNKWNTENGEAEPSEPQKGTETSPDTPSKTPQEEKQDPLQEIFNELLNTKNFFSAVDSNKDGEINKDEKEKFINIIKNLDGNEEDLSAIDLLMAADSINENKYNDLVQNYNNSQNQGSGASGASGVSGGYGSSGGYAGSLGSSGSYGSYGSSGSSGSSGLSGSSKTNAEDSTSEQKSLDKMTESELNSEHQTAKNDLESKQGILSGILDGSDSELQTLQEQVDSAYETYLGELKNVDEEMSKQLETLVDNMAQKENEVDTKEQEYSTAQQNTVSAKAALDQAVNTVSSLQDNLNALEAIDTTDFTDEQMNDLNAKKSATRLQLETAKGIEAEKNTEYGNAVGAETIAENNLNFAQGEYIQAENEKTNYEAEIAAQYPEIQEAMDNYNNAKKEYDTQKTEMTSNARQDIVDAQTRVSDIETELSARENKKNIKENLKFSDEPDLFDPDLKISTQFIEGEDGTLSYLLIGPENPDPDEELPLLVYLHGSGEIGGNENSLRSVGPGAIIPNWEELGMENFNGYILCPLLDKSEWNNDYATEKVDNTVNGFVNNNNVDTSRIALAGHSAGAKGTLYMMANSSIDYCRGGVLSGYDPSTDISKIDKPIRGYVGSTDDEASYKYMINTFKNTFGEENLIEYACGHAKIPEYVLNSDINGNNRSDFLEWMFGSDDL